MPSLMRHSQNCALTPCPMKTNRASHASLPQRCEARCPFPNSPRLNDLQRHPRQISLLQNAKREALPVAGPLGRPSWFFGSSVLGPLPLSTCRRPRQLRPASHPFPPQRWETPGTFHNMFAHSILRSHRRSMVCLKKRKREARAFCVAPGTSPSATNLQLTLDQTAPLIDTSQTEADTFRATQFQVQQCHVERVLPWPLNRFPRVITPLRLI